MIYIKNGVKIKRDRLEVIQLLCTLKNLQKNLNTELMSELGIKVHFIEIQPTRDFDYKFAEFICKFFIVVSLITILNS